MVKALFGDSSKHGTRIYHLICTKAGKFKAIATLVDEINNMEANENDLRKDVDQKTWEETSRKLIEEQKYTVGAHLGVKAGSQKQQ